jgi:hypothetical protein
MWVGGPPKPRQPIRPYAERTVNRVGAWRAGRPGPGAPGYLGICFDRQVPGIGGLEQLDRVPGGGPQERSATRRLRSRCRCRTSAPPRAAARAPILPFTGRRPYVQASSIRAVAAAVAYAGVTRWAVNIPFNRCPELGVAQPVERLYCGDNFGDGGVDLATGQPTGVSHNARCCELSSRPPRPFWAHITTAPSASRAAAVALTRTGLGATGRSADSVIRAPCGCPQRRFA